MVPQAGVRMDCPAVKDGMIVGNGDKGRDKEAV